MVLNPDVQEKAAKEVESVVGRERLPTFDDRGRLPYMECVYKECLRWSSVVPLSTCCSSFISIRVIQDHLVVPPHRLIEDDLYEDRMLPKGSMVSVNPTQCAY